MKFIIDHYAHDYRKTLYALNRLKNTEATFNGHYHEAMECCQILVETDKTEEELENWLYNRKGIGEFMGVVKAGT